MDMVTSVGCGESLLILSTGHSKSCDQAPWWCEWGVYDSCRGPTESWWEVGCTILIYVRGVHDGTGHKNTLTRLEGLLSFNPRIPESLAGKTLKIKFPYDQSGT